MPKNKRYNKTVIKALRIDQELNEAIAVLKDHRINWTGLVYDAMKEIILNKAGEIKYRQSDEFTPF